MKRREEEEEVKRGQYDRHKPSWIYLFCSITISGCLVISIEQTEQKQFSLMSFYYYTAESQQFPEGFLYSKGKDRTIIARNPQQSDDLF